MVGMKKKGVRTVEVTHALKSHRDEAAEDDGVYEIGVDEVGRGPLFGRVYAAAVILPRDDDDHQGASFDFSKMKDSKKFSSAKKISATSEYIKEHAVAWKVVYVEASEIDEINIRQAVLKAMRECITHVIRDKMAEGGGGGSRRHLTMANFFALVDGNDFPPCDIRCNNDDGDDAQRQHPLRFSTVEKGDNTYACIAAASILAKVARDDYIRDLCSRFPELSMRYALDRNMGYGTKKHIEGIESYGVTNLHRRSYGPCKRADLRVTMLQNDIKSASSGLMKER